MFEKLDLNHITPEDINAEEVDDESDIFMSFMLWLHDESQWDKIKHLDINTLARGMIHIANERRWGAIRAGEENAHDKNVFPVMLLERFILLYNDDDTFINMKWTRPFMQFLQWCGFSNDAIQVFMRHNADAHTDVRKATVNAYAHELGITPIYLDEE